MKTATMSAVTPVLFLTCFGVAHADPIETNPANLLAYVSLTDANATGCGAGTFQCLRVEVACPGQERKNALIQIKRAQGTVRGVVMLVNGGTSTAFWSNAAPSAVQAIADMNAVGLHTAEIRWETSWAALGLHEPQGHHHAACSTASVGEYLHNRFVSGYSDRSFCATGNSAGGSQISYMLSHYGFENRLTAAVVSGGPPMGRMDLGCSNDSTSSMDYSPSNVNLIDAAFGGINGTRPCYSAGSLNDTSGLPALRDASVAYSGDYHYPNTHVAFVWGTADTTNSVAQGATYTGTLVQNGQENMSVQILPGVEHGTHKTIAGATAISNTVIAHCAP